VKLSKTQQECLEELKKPNNKFHYMPYFGRFNPNAYYFSSATMKHFRERTVNKLVTMGYAKIVERNKYNNEHKVVLKES